ncbi:MAG: hypothetical protein QJR06_08020 [Alicyclobacillaceae bacterium]|nr:hypothetical protein [Alicyclobacillaceae bacterium]
MNGNVTAELQRQVDWLVQKAEEFGTYVMEALQLNPGSRDGSEGGKSGRNAERANDFGKSQIENLLAAMNHITSLAELELFVRYQMGRDDKRQGWAKVGDRFLSILQEIQHRGGEDLSEQDRRQLHRLMVNRFLLYWKWQHTYLSNRKPAGSATPAWRSSGRPQGRYGR